jgi:hypothetical protein
VKPSYPEHVYLGVPGDPAIRVCITHNPLFGLYGDEECAGGVTVYPNPMEGIIMTLPGDEQIVLTAEEAIAKMKWSEDDGGRYVHTLVQGGPVLLGATWSEDSVRRVLNETGHAELAGEAAEALGHGVVILEAGSPPVFCETK